MPQTNARVKAIPSSKKNFRLSADHKPTNVPQDVPHGHMQIITINMLPNHFKQTRCAGYREICIYYIYTQYILYIYSVWNALLVWWLLHSQTDAPDDKFSLISSRANASLLPLQIQSSDRCRSMAGTGWRHGWAWDPDWGGPSCDPPRLLCWCCSVRARSD